MELKFKALNNKAASPIINSNGAIELSAVEFKQEFDKSGKMILVYNTGLSVEIPDNKMIMIYPLESITQKSIQMISSPIIEKSGEIVARFKITTDALPSIYQEKEAVLQLVVVDKPNITATVEAFVDKKVEVEEAEVIENN